MNNRYLVRAVIRENFGTQKWIREHHMEIVADSAYEAVTRFESCCFLSLQPGETAHISAAFITHTD